MNLRHEFRKLITRVKWPERLVVIRHGQSEQNVAFDRKANDLVAIAEQKQIRDADVELTPTGVLQAVYTGKHLAHTEPFDICIASPYMRAQQTAQHIMDNLGYEVRNYTDARLREKEFGRLHGYTKEEILKQFPHEYLDHERDGKYWYRPPRGENYPDIEARLHSFLDKLSRNYAGQHVLVVTHQVPCKLFRSLFEHLTEEQLLGLENVPNCGIEEFQINRDRYPEGRLKLTQYNTVGYSMEQIAEELAATQGRP